MKATLKTTSILLATSILLSSCASATSTQSNPSREKGEAVDENPNSRSDTKIASSYMKEVLKKDWSYILYESDGGYVLSVICGTVALYTIQVQLNEYEVEKYKTNGIGYIDNLAKTIQSEPDKFKDR